MNSSLFLSSILYFLALINPASKVFLLCSIEPRPSRRELVQLALKSTLVAFLILLLVITLGTPLLDRVFHVQLYSLKVAGGVVLFLVGLSAIQRGRFHESAQRGKPDDLSIVPLGAPLIAGPGTITAGISFASEHGWGSATLAMTIALGLNFGLMLMAFPVGRQLERIHATGPLVRITGLIVAAVAAQIALDGLREWLALQAHN